MGTKRTYIKVSSEPLKNLIEKTDLTTKKLSDDIGVSCSGIGFWVREGKMPKYMLKVVEAYKARNRSLQATTFIVSGMKSEIQPYLQVIENAGFQITEIN